MRVVDVSPSGRLELPVGHGRLEALLKVPRSPRRAAVVLHGGGSTMNSGVVTRIARALAERDTAVLRFNFGGVGRSTGTFFADGGVGEQQDTRAALDFMTVRYADLPLWLAGVSFGAWVGFKTAIADPRVKRLLGVGLPIRMAEFDLSFLEDKGRKPLAVVQGANDEYGPRSEIKAFLAGLPDPKRLWIVDGATHSFSGKLPAVEAAAAKAITWLKRSGPSIR